MAMAISTKLDKFKYKIYEIMKKKIIILFVLAFISCKSNQVTYGQENCYKDTSFFSISKDELIFDLIKYQKELDNKKKKIVLNNKNFEYRFYQISNSGTIVSEYINKDIDVIKNIDYYPNGNIKFVSYNHNSAALVNLYKEFTYNENGEIIKTIDYEKGFKICYNEAIEICKNLVGERNLKKYNIKSFNLERNFDDGEDPNFKPHWIVHPMPSNEDENGNKYKIDYYLKYYKKNKGSLSYVIDGVTGKYRFTIAAVTVPD